MNDFTAFRESPAYRGNIHCHSTVSDGALTPHELVRRYREHGWSFLALSEHNTWSDYGGAWTAMTSSPSQPWSFPYSGTRRKAVHP